MDKSAFILLSTISFINLLTTFLVLIRQKTIMMTILEHYRMFIDFCKALYEEIEDEEE